MRLCFIDDTGDPGALSKNPPKGGPSAILGLIAVVIEADDVHELTHEVLSIKNNWPHVRSYSTRVLDRIDCEVKGASIRKGWCSGAAPSLEHSARATTDGMMDLLERLGAAVFGKVFVKHPGGVFDGQRLYNIALSHICEAFEAYLSEVDDRGLVILDTRNEGKNRDSAHSVFTRKHAATGDAFPHLLELPTFGDGKNHAGLQMADWLASALVAPLAWEAFCVDATPCPEWDAGYARLGAEYRDRLRARQYAYETTDGWRGAIHADDWRGHKPAKQMLALPSGTQLAALLAGRQ